MNNRFYALLLCSFFLFNTSFSQTVSVSGKVLRHNGEPIEGVTVLCSNAPSQLSDAEGNFTFTDLPEGEDYLIEGFLETNPYEDITVLDILYTRDGILAVNDFGSAFQQFAGDLNTSGGVTTFDIVYMSKASVLIDNNISNPYWYFFDEITMFPWISSGISLTNVTEDVTDLTLTAVKLGDIALEADHSPAPVDAPEPMYYFLDGTASAMEEITLNVLCDDYQRIVGFQQTLNWDPTLLEFIEHSEMVDLEFNLNQELVDEGNLLVQGVEFTGDSGITLDDGSVLYTVRFRALQDLSSLDGVIDFADVLIPQQTVYRGLDDDLYLVEDTFMGTTTSVGTIEGLENFAISPNPAQDKLFVEVNFESSIDATLTLLDINGRLIRNWAINNINFNESLSLESLAKGTYVLKLRTNDGVMAKKLIKQ